MITKENTVEELYNGVITQIRIISNENTKRKIYEQIENEIKELKDYKKAYQRKVSTYLEVYQNRNGVMPFDSIEQENEKINSLEISIQNIIKNSNEQIKLIKRNISLLYHLKKENDVDKLMIDSKKSHDVYQEIKNNFMNYSICGEKLILDYVREKEQKLEKELELELERELEKIESKLEQEKIAKEKEDEEKFQDNSILLISEIQNKVILPYTSEEVQEILNSEENEYQTEQDVIDSLFTRPLSDFKDSAISRFKEAYNLATKKDKYSKLDGIQLGIELFGKRFLHPAIISACRSTDELDVYLDCLSKNELNEFKIFDIQYEVYPIAVKQKNIFWRKRNVIEKIEENCEANQ